MRIDGNGCSSSLPASEFRIGNRALHDAALGARGRIQRDTIVVGGIDKRGAHIVVVEMRVLPVDMKGGDIVETITVAPRTEHLFHPRTAGSARVIAIRGMRKADDDMLSQVLVAFCVWLAGLIVTGLLSLTTRHLVEPIGSTTP